MMLTYFVCRYVLRDNLCRDLLWAVSLVLSNLLTYHLGDWLTNWLIIQLFDIVCSRRLRDVKWTVRRRRILRLIFLLYYDWLRNVILRARVIMPYFFNFFFKLGSWLVEILLLSDRLLRSNLLLFDWKQLLRRILALVLVAMGAVVDGCASALVVLRYWRDHTRIAWVFRPV
jgi:hypothetical protein